MKQKELVSFSVWRCGGGWGAPVSAQGPFFPLFRPWCGGLSRTSSPLSKTKKLRCPLSNNKREIGTNGGRYISMWAFVSQFFFYWWRWKRALTLQLCAASCHCCTSFDSKKTPARWFDARTVVQTVNQETSISRTRSFLKAWRVGDES